MGLGMVRAKMTKEKLNFYIDRLKCNNVHCKNMIYLKSRVMIELQANKQLTLQIYSSRQANLSSYIRNKQVDGERKLEAEVEEDKISKTIVLVGEASESNAEGVAQGKHFSKNQKVHAAKDTGFMVS